MNEPFPNPQGKTENTDDEGGLDMNQTSKNENKFFITEDEMLRGGNFGKQAQRTGDFNKVNSDENQLAIR